jgi:glutamate racemase
LKVGVFDSGIGGLTVLKSILKVLQNSEIFYIADTLFAPYGEKNSDEILKRSQDITKHLIKNHQIDALIVACNTATTAAIKNLRQDFPSLIIVGTEPGIKPAILNTKSLNIGILATPSTLKSDKYQLLVNELSSQKKVNLFEQACEGLAMQIEEGEANNPKIYKMLETWLKPMKEAKVDTIVLGCTHYPLIKEPIKKIMGEEITLIETGDAIASRLLSLSEEKGHKNIGNLKLTVFHTGNINFEMIKTILDDKNIEIRKCEI